MSPLSQKLSELRPFPWVKSWRNLKSKKFQISKYHCLFEIWTNFFFLVTSIYISESRYKVSRSNNNIEPLNWVWVCGYYQDPECGNVGITRTQNPGADRVKDSTNNYHSGIVGDWIIYSEFIVVLIHFFNSILLSVYGYGWSYKKAQASNSICFLSHNVVFVPL